MSLSAGKKSTSSPNLFAEMLQRYEKYYFGYFELACICTSKNLVAFFIAVQKPSLNEQKEAIFFTPFLKRHHVRDVYNNFNDLLQYFLLILWQYLYVTVLVKIVTYLHSTDDGIQYQKFMLIFTFSKVVSFTILILETEKIQVGLGLVQTLHQNKN